MRITCAPTRLALKYSGVGEGAFALPLVFFFGRGFVRDCGGAALDRGPCLEGATSRPAAKSLPKGAKSYLKDNAGNRKRLGTVRHGRAGDTTHSPSTTETSCGRGFFLLFPYTWDFFSPACVVVPPPPPSPPKSLRLRAGTRGSPKLPPASVENAIPKRKGGDPPPGTPCESPGAGWRASKPQTQTLPVPRQCAPEVAGGAGVFLILSASLLDFISKKEGGVRCADEFMCCYFLEENDYFF